MATVLDSRRNEILDYAKAPVVVEWLQGAPATVIELGFTQGSSPVSITSWMFTVHMEAAVADYSDGEVRDLKALVPQPALGVPRLVSTSSMNQVLLVLPPDFYMVEVPYAASTKVPCVVVAVVADTGPAFTDGTNIARFTVVVRRGI